MENLQELKNIASNYRVLYVEDEKEIANLLIQYLANFFSEVVYAENGKEALSLYEEGAFELVITDIEMPFLNGLDLSYEIKQISKYQNVIITSAYSDIAKFQSSIKLGIDGYLVKPINYNDMNNLLVKLITNIKKDKDLVDNKDKLENFAKQVNKKNIQLNQYVDILNHVALVSKMDLLGNITYVNSFFCEISGYTESELIGHSHNIVKHPDMPKSVYADLMDTISKGIEWKGTIKNKTKDDSTYFVHVSIIPIFNDKNENIEGFMGIGFLTTKEEMEKREFKKKVMTSYQEFRKNTIMYDKQIEELQVKLKALLSEQSYVKELNVKLEEKNRRLLSQISYYEKGHSANETSRQKTIGRIDNRITNLEDNNKKLKNMVFAKDKELNFLKIDYEIKKEKLKDMNDHLEIQRKTILDLTSTITVISEDINNKKNKE